jgi:hypothetical protein
VHPVLPYVLTSSDDMLIKLWDWDKGWACVQVFEGHNHYVVQVRYSSPNFHWPVGITASSGAVSLLAFPICRRCCAVSCCCCLMLCRAAAAAAAAARWCSTPRTPTPLPPPPWTGQSR